MKKLLSFIVILSLGITISIGQNIKPEKISPVLQKEAQGMDQYMSKYAPSSTKAVIWSSSMSNTTDWTVTQGTDQTLSTNWVRIADTSLASAKWKQYVGVSQMAGSTCTNGVYYFDGITNLVNGVYGTANSKLTNTVPINTTGHPSVVIKFFQLYKAFNGDSALLEISSDNVNWYTIDVNQPVAVNTYAYGWREYNISPWAGNKTQLWIRFRFYGPATYGSGPQYGGGYGWMIDDVSISDAENNKLTYNKIWVYDAYTELPTNQNIPISFMGEIINSGGLAQTNVKISGKEITTNTVLAGTVKPSVASAQTDTLVVDNFFTPTTVGNYKITSWVSSDNIPYENLGDTFNLKVSNNQLMSRDNNYYYTSKWNSGDGYTVANLYEVLTNDTAFGVKVVVNLASEVGSQIQGVLYRGSGQSRLKIAESDYYTLQASDIPVNTGLNPVSITLPFTTPVILEKDSAYWAGMATAGGEDTVKIACDNALLAHSGGIPQNYYTSTLYDNVDNKWYVWSFAQQAAMMIRLSFDHTIKPSGINEINSANLFSCMPNPANNSTRISYELKNTQKVTILVTDITGRTIMTLNEGTKIAGNYGVDLDLTDLTSGTYFYTLKTDNSQSTKKLVVVKR